LSGALAGYLLGTMVRKVRQFNSRKAFDLTRLVNSF